MQFSWFPSLSSSTKSATIFLPSLLLLPSAFLGMIRPQPTKLSRAARGHTQPPLGIAGGAHAGTQDGLFCLLIMVLMGGDGGRAGEEDGASTHLLSKPLSLRLSCRKEEGGRGMLKGPPPTKTKDEE